MEFPTEHQPMLHASKPDTSNTSHWANFPAGLRVMVVDDDPLCLKVVEQMLKRCKYEVTTCNNASTALESLRDKTQEFDLVLSDVYMPDMDGFKLLEHIGLELDLPVIMMSSNGEINTVFRGVTHGAVDFLIKPVRIEELRNIWQHVLRRKHQIKEEGDDTGQDKDDSGESRKRKNEMCREGSSASDLVDEASAAKKPRVVWSVEMHQQFVNAVNQLGIDKAVPKKILELMQVDGLTRENVASHLQKYRLYLKRVAGVQPTAPKTKPPSTSAPALMPGSSQHPPQTPQPAGEPSQHMTPARPPSCMGPSPSSTTTQIDPSQNNHQGGGFNPQAMVNAGPMGMGMPGQGGVNALNQLQMSLMGMNPMAGVNLLAAGMGLQGLRGMGQQGPGMGALGAMPGMGTMGALSMAGMMNNIQQMANMSGLMAQMAGLRPNGPLGVGMQGMSPGTGQEVPLMNNVMASMAAANAGNLFSGGQGGAPQNMQNELNLMQAMEMGMGEGAGGMANTQPNDFSTVFEEQYGNSGLVGMGASQQQDRVPQDGGQMDEFLDMFLQTRGPQR